MKEVYFTAWLFSKPQVLRWPVARAVVLIVVAIVVDNDYDKDTDNDEDRQRLRLHSHCIARYHPL